MDEETLFEKPTGGEKIGKHTLDAIDKSSFMFNIGGLVTLTCTKRLFSCLDLLTDSEYEECVLVVDRRRTLRKTSRVLTYVPEISDRKFRYQTFLQNSLSSPPHLRRRTREQQAATPPAPRHATPDRMETRNKTAKLDKVTPNQFDTKQESFAFTCLGSIVAVCTVHVCP